MKGERASPAAKESARRANEEEYESGESIAVGDVGDTGDVGYTGDVGATEDVDVGDSASNCIVWADDVDAEGKCVDVDGNGKLGSEVDDAENGLSPPLPSLPHPSTSPSHAGTSAPGKANGEANAEAEVLTEYIDFHLYDLLDSPLDSPPVPPHLDEGERVDRVDRADRVLGWLKLGLGYITLPLPVKPVKPISLVKLEILLVLVLVLIVEHERRHDRRGEGQRRDARVRVISV
ncbi:hypothetical protein EYR36_009674 [Pleurotus pulmonarius]|nr:hypothetical protein EYR36_009674 [Pleurotus pulmonarius]